MPMGAMFYWMSIFRLYPEILNSQMNMERYP